MIRPATLEDIPTMLALGRVMHQESIYAPYDFDDDKVIEMFTALISTQFGIALVAEQEGVVIGGFIGVVQKHWFGNDTQASDIALFIAPEHRGGRTGLMLIKAYVQAALNKGAKQVLLANSTGVQTDRVAKLFESFGFQRRGFVFELPNA